MNIGKILILGFGSVGQGLLPLLFREFPDLAPSDIQIIAADDNGVHIAKEYKVPHLVQPLTPDNYIKFLKIYLEFYDVTSCGYDITSCGYDIASPCWEIPGNECDNLIEMCNEIRGSSATSDIVREDTMNILINVSVDVSSCDLIQWCKDNNTLYLDTCVEPWKGGYDNQDIMSTTNFYLREQALSLKEQGAPTALIAHGANPGLITHLLKEGLLAIANDKNLDVLGKSWAQISHDLGIQVIQIAEHDNQTTDYHPEYYDPKLFYNTWSCEGFLSELYQRAELSWGSHEDTLPPGAILNTVRGFNSVVLPTRSLDTRVRSFSMISGRIVSTLVTHHEALSIGEMLTLNSGDTHYQPTVYYAYRPCNLAEKSLSVIRLGGVIEGNVILKDELTRGSDSLHVMIFLQDGNAYLVGNSLALEKARSAAPHNSATTLQVTASIVAGIHWMLDHPYQGVTEAEQTNHREISQVTKPYIGATISSQVWASTHVIPGTKFQDFVVKENK